MKASKGNWGCMLARVRVRTRVHFNVHEIYVHDMLMPVCVYDVFIHACTCGTCVCIQALLVWMQCAFL